MVFTWRSQFFNTKAESLRQENNAMCLVGPPWYCVLQTVDARRDHVLIERRPEEARRHGKETFLHNNYQCHTAKPVKDTLKSLGWDILPLSLYAPDLLPSDYYIFATIGHALAEQHFSNFEEVGKRLNEWFTAKCKQVSRYDIHKLPESWVLALSRVRSQYP
ncbi:mariner Mos1 transposase [Trichonephila clavipes]|nr:mariner Mos1 transposase [Trichonephila clavipes]